MTRKSQAPTIPQDHALSDLCSPTLLVNQAVLWRSEHHSGRTLLYLQSRMQSSNVEHETRAEEVALSNSYSCVFVPSTSAKTHIMQENLCTFL